MGETIDTAPEQRRAVLVAVVRERQDERQANEYLDELEFLAETAGIRSVKRFTQRLAAPSAKTFIGEGKLAEIAAFVEENEIRYVIFDDELSPSQLRNLDKVFKNKIYDRTSLILDIFVQRATTAYAKAQVELAQCQYLLPRLAGMWTHLERQRGGTGTRGGAGEREIETDRRVIRNRISRLKEQLSKIDRQMAVQRGNRGSLVRVALVGYTNVGKSTLMNLHSEKRGFRREQALRDARHDGPQGRFGESALSAVGHRWLHPQAAPSARRVVQVDARRGARGRLAAACGRHFASELRGADRRRETRRCRR